MEVPLVAHLAQLKDRTQHSRNEPRQLPDQEESQSLSAQLPSLPSDSRCRAFTSIEREQRAFYPDIKVHTSDGQELRGIPQTHIHFASKEYRLRSDHLAKTLRLFSHKVSRALPDGFCVQVELSPLEGSAACDTVTLINYSSNGGAEAILEQRYKPFDGGGIGWMVPTDEAKNTVLKLEERLFYYKTLLAIKTAISTRASRLSAK